MEEILTINKNRALLPSEDYVFLREEGLKHIQNLAGKVWTDYNTHDPGVTMLELLSYAITDLGYRTSKDTKDLLAESNSELASNSFHTALDILSSNPVSTIDIRKILIDNIPELRNAWVYVSNGLEISYGINYLESKLEDGNDIEKLNGLYKIILEPKRGFDSNDEELVDELIKKSKNVLHQYRNLCEDYFEVIVTDVEKISINAAIEISKDADPEVVLAEIYFQLEKLISPLVKFHSLEEMREMGKSTEEIFEGPILQNGFIDTEELSIIEPKNAIYTSDIINELMDIEGVLEINSIKLFGFITDRLPDETVNTEDSEGWILNLREGELTNPENYNPVFDIDNSSILLLKDTSPIQDIDLDENIVINRFNNLALSEQKKARVSDLPIPEGNFENLEDYSALQNELPLVYGTGQFGLPETATEERRGQAKQLKAYLLFFEQILANYFSQLSNAKDLLSWKEIDQTYFSQDIKEIIKDGQLLFDNDLDNTKLNELAEDEFTFFDRRNRFIEHQIARFNEEMVEYSIMMYGILSFQDANTDLIEDKINFLKEYPTLSADRGKGFNYKELDENSEPDVWDTNNVPGYQKRVARLLGFDDYSRRFLYNMDTEGLHVLEHILFRPKSEVDSFLKVNIGPYPDSKCHYEEDPYSFRMTILLPAFMGTTEEPTGRFTEFNFRKHAEKIMRMEAPAHIALDIIWVGDSIGLEAFENCYKEWLEENAKEEPTPEILSDKLNCLLNALNNFENYYDAKYTIENPRNEDTYSIDNEVIATVYDPVGEIVSAEIVNIVKVNNSVTSTSNSRPFPVNYTPPSGSTVGNIEENPAKHFINFVTAVPDPLVNDDETDPLNKIGTFSIFLDNDIEDKAGKWHVDIITTNEFGGQTYHNIIIEIIDDYEAEYIINAPKNEDNYQQWDVLAYVQDGDGTNFINVISAEILPSVSIDTGVIGIVTSPTTIEDVNGGVVGGIPAVGDNSPNDPRRVGSIVALDSLEFSSLPIESGHYVFDVGIKTVDEDGGITVHNIEIKILVDIDAIYTVNPPKSVYAYLENEEIATVEDENGAISEATLISGNLPPGTKIVDSGDNLGNIEIEDLDLFKVGVLDDLNYSQTFSQYNNCDYKDIAPNPSVSYTSIILTKDETGGVTEQSVTIVINRDSAAAYSFVNKAVVTSSSITLYADEFSLGEEIATVLDPDGLIIDAVYCGDFINGATLNPITGKIHVTGLIGLPSDTGVILPADSFEALDTDQEVS